MRFFDHRLSFQLRKASLYLYFGLFLFARAEDQSVANKEKKAVEQGQKAQGFDSSFSSKSNREGDYGKESEFLNKKFKASTSSSFDKSATGFEKKFETSTSSPFNKSYPIESKSFTVKSADLGKESSFQKKSSDLIQKGSAGFDKTFETKAYNGPETPQAQKEIRELLKQKGGDAKSGDRPLSIEEVKEIVNRDIHRIPSETRSVEVPKESAIDSNTSNR